MRLNINLASRPYEDIRSFNQRWGAIAALLAVLTAALIFYAVRSWRESRDVNQQISNVQSEIRNLDQEKRAGIALLNKPENQATAAQSHFLNQLIARKSFSWTKVFMDLERLMPPGLHVVSIEPSLGNDNQLQVNMVVGGSSRERAIELVRRMEQSQTFRHSQVQREAVRERETAGEGDLIRFEISSIYVPEVATAGEPDKTPEPGKEQPKPTKTAAVGGLH